MRVKSKNNGKAWGSLRLFQAALLNIDKFAISKGVYVLKILNEG
jgi:hypothetical protein